MKVSARLVSVDRGRRHYTVLDRSPWGGPNILVEGKRDLPMLQFVLYPLPDDFTFYQLEALLDRSTPFELIIEDEDATHD